MKGNELQAKDRTSTGGGGGRRESLSSEEYVETQM
jgi:hypothetical protein